jgi:cytoskeletal protein RodZ
MEKILGQALKKEREMRGISLAEIAAETRIGTRFLQAMEVEEFDMIPGNFYIYYYIKNYLKACGADDTAFFNTYQAYLKNILKKDDALPPEQYLNKMDYLKYRKSKRILAVVLLLACLGFLLYLFLGRPRLWNKISAGANLPGMGIPAFSRSLLKHEADFCLSVPPLVAQLAFDESCWLQLWRGGEKIEERTFRKGEVFTLGGYQLIMVIANPPALRLTLNGQDVSFFRTSPTPLKLVVNPENLQQILQR